MVATPIVNQGQKHIEGLLVSHNADKKLDVSAGQARDSSNTNDIILGSSVTIDASNNGKNGLDSGSLANNTLYAVYAIGDSRDKASAAAIVSSDMSQPVLPKDYDMYRLIGYVRTDGSANFLVFHMYGDGHYRMVWYDAIRSVLSNGTSTSWAEIDLSSDMPSIATQVVLDVSYTPNSATNKAYFRTIASSEADGQVKFGYGVAGAQVGMAKVPADVDSGSVKIEYKVDNSSDDLDASLAGYEVYL